MRHSPGRAWILVGSLACTLPLGGSLLRAEERVLTLERVRRGALEHRVELQVADAKVLGARAQVRAAKASLRPQVAGSVEASSSPGGQLVELPSGELLGLEESLLVSGSPTVDQGLSAFEPRFRYGGLIGLDWNLYDFGRTKAALAAARSEAKARVADRDATTADLLQAVDAAYLEWLLSYEEVRFRRREVDRIEAQLEELDARVEEGLMAPSARYSVEVELLTAKLRTASAQEVERKAQGQLRSAAGVALPRGARPDLTLLDLGEAGPGETAQEELGEPRDLNARARALEARIAAANANVAFEERASRPNVSASAQVGVRGQAENVFPVYRATVNLRIPLFDGGRRGAKRDLALAEKSELLALQQKLAREEALRREDLQARLETARERVGLAERLVDVSGRRLSDAEERFLEGQADGDEVSRAREARARAISELLFARVERTRAALLSSPTLLDR